MDLAKQTAISRVAAYSELHLLLPHPSKHTCGIDDYTAHAVIPLLPDCLKYIISIISYANNVSALDITDTPSTL